MVQVQKDIFLLQHNFSILYDSGVSLVYRTSLGANTGFYSNVVMSLNFQNADASGSFFTLSDWCGNNNNGVNRGVTGFSYYDNPLNTIAVNECISLDGNGDYLSGPDHPAVSPVSGITLSAWVYPESFDANTSIYSTIIHKGNSSGTVTDYRIQIQKKKFLFFINETQVFPLHASEEIFPLNQWTHFAITYSGASGQIIYVHNGSIFWDDTVYVGNIHDNNDSIYIGGTPALKQFDGLIDEVKITSSPLSYGEITNRMFTSVNELNDPVSTNVVYNFDGGLVPNSNSGPRLALRNNAAFSYNTVYSNIPVSPLTFSFSTSFPQSYYMSSVADGRIPASGTSGFMISDTIDVPLSETITDVNVYVGLNHKDEDNLILSLISPSGTTVTLYSTTSLIGASEHINTIFDDQADFSLLTNAYVMYAPTIRPLNNLNTALSGSNTKGKWKLRIQDAAANDTGKLYGWGIRFNNHSSRKKVLSLTALMQGFYNSSTNLMIPDTMRVSIRNGLSPYSVIETATKLLNDSGKAEYVFNNVSDGIPVYIELNHRNSIETWSKTHLSTIFSVLQSFHFSPFTSLLNYNFTTLSFLAFGDNQIQVDTSPTRFAIYGGDVNKDGVVDETDTQLIDNDAFNFVTGYVVTDVNGDGITDGSDGVLAGNNSENFVSAVLP